MLFFAFFSSHKDPGIQLRKNDLLVRRMRAIRKTHRVTQTDLGACMSLGEQTIKAIESGRQQLPGIQPGSGSTLHDWFDDWYRCLSVTDEEYGEVENLLILKVVGRKRRNPSQLE